MGMCYSVKTEELVLKSIWEESNSFRNSYCEPLMSLLSCGVNATLLLEIEKDLADLSAFDIIKKFNLSNDDLRDIDIRCISQNIKEKVCQINMLSFAPLITRDVMKEFNVNGIVFVRAKDIGNIKRLIDEFDNNIRLGVVLDPLGDGDQVVNQISDVCAKYSLPVLVKLYDDLDKTGQLDSLYKMSPTRYIESVGLLDRECFIYGGIHADKDDFEIWSGYGGKVIISPTAFMYLGKGMANLPAMINSGVEVQLASTLENDILEEVKIATLLARGILSNPGILETEDVEDLAKADRDSEILRKNTTKSLENCKKILERIKEGL